MALDVPLPKTVVGHPWLLQGEGKMSKSKGNVIYADDLVRIFGLDAVRYYLLREMPFENDGIISYELLIDRINSDLANTLGNLVNRTISMSNKYFDGIVEDKKVNESVDEELKNYILSQVKLSHEKMDIYHAAESLAEIMNVFKRLNKYIDETMPWALAKDESKKDRLSTVLYNLIEGINIGATLIKPYMPDTADTIFELIDSKIRKYDEMDKFGLYPSGNRVSSDSKILFARLDMKEMLEKIDAENMAKAEADVNKNKESSGDDKPYLPNIDFDDFAKLDLRVGEILTSERVKDSKKLLKFSVKIGNDTRTILSGLYPNMTAEEMIGKKVAVLTNLPKRKMAGIESEGMLLCAEDKDGKLAMLTVDRQISSGSLIS